MTAEGVPPRLALVTWEAEVGGAETLILALAQRLGQLGAQAELVVVGGAGRLLERVGASGVRYRTVGLNRGRDVLRHPRRLAGIVAAGGPDGALLPECGYLGACLRMGGYRGTIVGVEHGIVLFPRDTRLGRVLDGLTRAAGAWADDAQVGVSDLVLERMRAQPHSARLRRIYNGIDPEAFAPAPARPAARKTDHLVLGFAGRLIAGKGLDVLIPAIARARQGIEVKLLVAGDGPERPALNALAGDLVPPGVVQFLGMIDDIQGFWQRCDVAVVPSSSFIESFCLAAVEAAACGKPLIATRNGALPEVVRDGSTGILVAPGDIEATARAIVAYAREPSLVDRHAAAARPWAIQRFSLDDCARAYLDLFTEIDRSHRRR
jgi:glycosyltransferase involved in cell wall biosynthesis